MVKNIHNGSCIGYSMEVQGNVRSVGKVVIAGSFEGNLRAEEVELTATGIFIGKLICRIFLSRGRVRGLVVAETVHLLSGSSQYGRVRAVDITLEDGVLFEYLEPIQRRGA